jgi:type I restriction enzyme S subunit
MNKLDELIAEFCPDGVEFAKLGDCCAIEDNKRKPIKASERTTGKTPYYGANNIQDYVDGFTHDGEYVLIAEDGSSSLDNYSIQCVSGKFWANNHVHVVKGNEELNSRFLYHFLTTFNFVPYLVGGTRAKLNRASMIKIPIPLPPLPVQNEIVRILDNFTELTAELTARKKQYEYYRKQALCFDGNTPMERLGDTCLMKSGKAIKATFISETQSKTNQYKCYGGNGVRGFVSELSHQGEYPIIGRQGALCGNINYAVGDFYATEHAVVVKSLGKYIPRFLFYLLTAMNLNQYKSQGAQPGLAVGNIENLLAPVPSIKKQEYIVNLLDRFDTLCNDISTGLPAEIEARQKQYEYYRDKLLTFKESSDEN